MSDFSCHHLIHRIQGALSVHVSDAEVDLDTKEIGALSFQHPAHQATVFVFVEQGDTRQPLPTVALFVLIDDWEEVRQDLGQVTRLMQLNGALMTCSVGVLQLNDDEMATALCRRLPAEAVEVDEVFELVEGMIWEYAHAAGFVEQATPGGQEPAEA